MANVIPPTISITFHASSEDLPALHAALGISLDADGNLKPPEPYETWEAYHAEVYRLCDQLRAMSSVADVTYNEATGELCIFSVNNTVWRGGIPEFQRQYEAIRNAQEADHAD